MKGNLLHLLLHFDIRPLKGFIHTYGAWIYGMMFGALFLQTGFVLAVILPGDSLLFAAGLLSRPEQGMLNVTLLLLLMPVAVAAGDIANYFVGKFFASVLYKPDDSGLLKNHHLAKTRDFFTEHGQKAILMGHFVPVVRTVLPFVAGLDGMPIKTYFSLSVIAAVLWVFVCVGAGYLLGGFRVVRDHFSEAMVLIVLLGVFAFVIEAWRRQVKSKRQAAQVSQVSTPSEGGEVGNGTLI
jgi:membrane-associated protein